MSKKPFKLVSIALITLVMALSNFNLFGQQTYYWYFDKKVPVKYEKSVWAIKFNQSSKGTQRADFLRLNSYRLKKTVKIKEDFERVDFSNPLNENDLETTNIEFAIPALVIGKQDEPILMSGKIVVMPRKEFNIAFIEKEYDVVFLEKTNFGGYLFQAKKPIRTLDIANKIHEKENVKWCSPDFYVKLTVFGSDPLYSQQYYLNSGNDIDINAPEAWSITKGCDNIRVAVLDEGVEAHEDLDGRVLQGYTAGTNNTLGAPIMALEGHGVACAGIIAASHDNDKGLKGIAPFSKIVPVKLLGDGATYGYSTSEVAQAITWSYQSSGGNADILSNSWGVDAQGLF
jgi:serine protease